MKSNGENELLRSTGKNGEKRNVSNRFNEDKLNASTDLGRTHFLKKLFLLSMFSLCAPAWPTEQPGEAVVAESLIKDLIYPSMVELNFCGNLKECRNKEYVLYNVGVNNINFEFYRIAQDARTEELLSRLIPKVARLNYKMKYRFSFFDAKHEANVFWKQKYFLIINIEKSQ